MIRTKGEAGTGNIVEAVRHLRAIRSEIRRLEMCEKDELFSEAKRLGAPFELVAEVGMHQPGVSRHLKVLRDAGLVDVRPDAQRRLYRLRPEPLMELDEWLEPFRREWSDRLDALERHLQRTTKLIRTNPKGPR